MVDHRAEAERAFDLAKLPPPLRPVGSVLVYLDTLLALLPPEEMIGYVRGPAGGENVTPLPDGRGLVRISRVMSHDGQIYKVMNDAPNGGPQWIPEDVRPDLYVPFLGAAPPDMPDAPDDLTPRVAQLEALFNEIVSQLTTLNRQNAGLDARVVDLETRVGTLEHPPPVVGPARPWWLGWT